MNRIIIIGSGGSGKSTLAIKLKKILDEKKTISLYHMDQLFWKEGWVEGTQEELRDKLQTIFLEERWIIDGNYSGTMPMRLERCDTVIYLDYSRYLSLWSVVKRVRTSRGKVRADMAKGCPEKWDWDFILWIWNFNKKNRKRIHGWIKEAKARGKEVYYFRNRKDCQQWLMNVEKNIKDEA